MSETTVAARAPDDSNDIGKALAAIPLFQDLPPAVDELLKKNSDRRRYEPGQTVISLGQYDGEEFFILLKGRLRVSALDPNTGSILIEHIEKNGVFGLETILAKSPAETFQQLSIIAEEESELVAVDADAFGSIASGRPSLMRNIARHFAAQLLEFRFKAMSTQTAPEQKVFAALLQYVKRDPESGLWRIGKMPKHRELADQAGVEEADSANAVASLIQEGVAKREYPGLIINDMQRLNKLAS